MFLAAVVCRWKSMFTYLVPGADFLSCFAFTRCLTELFMDLFQFGQVQFTKDNTQGHLTQIFPTFPNTIVNLDFYMKTDSGLSWVSNDR